MNPPSISSFYAYPTNISEVEKSFQNKSAGDYIITVFIYKLVINILSPIVTNLFNESLKFEIFPDCLKVAKTVPIHKASDKKNVKNYRQISMMPFLSTIFERFMYKWVNSFLKTTEALCNNQFGFRQNSNTSDAVL